MKNDIVKINAFHSRKLEYKRQNLWVMSIDGIDAYLFQSTNRPKLAMGEGLTVKYINTYSKYSGNTGEWQPLDCEINDPITPSASKIVFDKIKKQWDWETGRSGSKDQYAIPKVLIKLLAPDYANKDISDDNSFIEIWELNNVFFGDIDWGGNPLQYSSSDRLTVKLNLVYDYANLLVDDKQTARFK